MGIPGWMAASGKGATDVARTMNDSALVLPQHVDSEAAGGFTKLGERDQGALQGQEEPHMLM